MKYVHLNFVAFSVIWLNCAWAESPVNIPDPALKAAVEEALSLENPTPTDMLGLTSLTANAQGIFSLSGLEYATNLEAIEFTFNRINSISSLSALTNLKKIVLNNNQIGDMSVVAGLSNLVHLDIHNNNISDISAVAGLCGLRTVVLRINQIIDISPLSGLSDLEYLDMRDNQIYDLWPLSGLSKLRIVDLWGNHIADVSPLCHLMALASLELGNNPLNQEACDTYLPQIIANNPGIRISHRPCNPLCVSVTATAGGRVTSPGEGEFIYEYGNILVLEALANPGFRFVCWSGSFFSTSPSICMTVEQDHRIRATFEAVAVELYVDDDAPSDPDPGNVRAGDPDEDGTADRPFDSIQEAIDVAIHGATIVVRPGIYRENLNLLGKMIHLLALNADNPYAGPCAIVEGVGGGPVVTIPWGSGSQCGLTGFVLTKGEGQTAGGVHCTGSSPAFTNCLIVGNRCTDPNGAVLYFRDSKAVLANCTIADNDAGTQGAGLRLEDSALVLRNCILWGNAPREIASSGQSVPSIRYCCIRGWWPDIGNTLTDPMFAHHGSWAVTSGPTIIPGPADAFLPVWTEGDYHLKSQAGRWNAATGSWLLDSETSPCIDAGDPTYDVGHEPSPNGGLVNMGAYGGTTEASKSR